MKTVTLVPRRADGGQRDALWRHCRARWEHDYPDWPIHEGHHTEGLFNRSAAINAASAEAGEWDVAVIIDSDIVCDPRIVRDAVDYAHLTGKLMLGGDQRVMLSQSGTEKILDGYDGDWWPLRETVNPDETMCCMVVARSLWDRVGGFDPLFVGYGFEDLAFIVACETMTGETVLRLPGLVYHLWHPPAEGSHQLSRIYRNNRWRYKRYHQAGGKVAEIDVLLTEAHATRS